MTISAAEPCSDNLKEIAPAGRLAPPNHSVTTQCDVAWSPPCGWKASSVCKIAVAHKSSKAGSCTDAAAHADVAFTSAWDTRMRARGSAAIQIQPNQTRSGAAATQARPGRPGFAQSRRGVMGCRPRARLADCPQGASTGHAATSPCSGEAASKHGATSLVSYYGLEALVDRKTRPAMLRSCDMSLTCCALSSLPRDLGVSRQQVADSLRRSSLLAARMRFGVPNPLLFYRPARMWSCQPQTYVQMQITP